MMEQNAIQIYAADEAMKRKGTGSTSSSKYSEDFPDSTKGTALLSPPDPGTSSPLDWSPGLSFEFADFANHQFLNPTLSDGHHHGRRHRAASGDKAPKDVLNPQDLSAPLDHTLRPPYLQPDVSQPDILNSSGPTSILDQQ